MNQMSVQRTEGPHIPERRVPPRVLFVLTYPVALLIQLGIASFRMGELEFGVFWHALGLFPVGLGALLVWSEEAFQNHTFALLVFGWIVWIVVVGAGLIAPTYRKLTLVGIVAIANIGGCNLDHFWVNSAQ
jgi:hypothetical protein